MPDIQNGAISIHYQVVGVGAPLLCLHGMWGSHEVFEEGGWVAALAGDHRLLLPDLRGNGASDKPHDASAYEREQLVSDVLTILDAEGIASTALFGYSMGGWIAYAVAQAAPERVRALIVGGAGLDPHQTHGASAMRFGLRLLDQDLPTMIRAMTLPNLPESTRQRLLRSDEQALRALMTAWIMGQKGEVEALSQFDRPALIFAGDRDPNESAARACAAALPQGRFALLPGHTHDSALLSAPDAIAIVRAFLDEIETGGHAPFS
ncbi:MAG: alpha/beta fold hydrolase [Anaerolineales bacterium]